MSIVDRKAIQDVAENFINALPDGHFGYPDGILDQAAVIATDVVHAGIEKMIEDIHSSTERPELHNAAMIMSAWLCREIAHGWSHRLAAESYQNAKDLYSKPN